MLQQTPSNLFYILLYPNQFTLLDPTLETIYTYFTSHPLDVKDQLNFKEPKSETPSLLIFETNQLIRSNVILKSSY